MSLIQLVAYCYQNCSRTIEKSYSQLLLNQLDIGFTSVIKDGKDFHQLTRDLVVSFNRFENGRQTNVVFEKGGSSICLELTDPELDGYYSDYIELRYIMFGKLRVEIAGELLEFNQGDICFISSIVQRRELLKDMDCMLVNINIDKKIFTEAFLNSIELDALKKYVRTNILKRSEQLHCLCFTPLSEASAEKINDYLYTIVSEIIQERAGFEDISRGYLIRLMDYLTNNYQYNTDRKSSQLYAEKLFESIQEYICAHLDTVTMNDLIHNFHFQSNYFNNLIKKHTGMTYSQYVIYQRIERAKELLYTTELSIEEIMWLIGYNNKGFFYRKFQELVGMSPKAYRQKSE